MNLLDLLSQDPYEIKNYCSNWPILNASNPDFESYGLDQDQELDCENFEIEELTKDYAKISCFGDWQPETWLKIKYNPEDKMFFCYDIEHHLDSV